MNIVENFGEYHLEVWTLTEEPCNEAHINFNKPELNRETQFLNSFILICGLVYIVQNKIPIIFSIEVFLVERNKILKESQCFPLFFSFKKSPQKIFSRWIYPDGFLRSWSCSLFFYSFSPNILSNLVRAG